jgi:thiol-disulfide isomerase/thioredoxin
MKKLLVLFLISSILFSCKNEKKGIFINGNIINSGQSYMMIYLPGGTNDTIPVDVEGSFSWTFPDPEEPVSCNLMFNKVYMPLYLVNGMNLIVTLDADDLPGSLKFEGDGADLNNYLALLAMKEKELNLNDYEIFKKDSSTFFAWNDGVRETQIRLYNEYTKEDPSDIFWKTQLAEINFGWANRMDMYPSYYSYYTDTTFKAPAGYYEYYNVMEINNSGNLNSSEFKSFLNSYMNKKTSDALLKFRNDSVKPSRYLINMKTALEVLNNDSVKNSYLASYVKGLISYKDFSEITGELKFFRENCADKKLLDGFDKEYQARMLIQKGQQAIDFTGETATGEKVKLSDFKGKYIYVDVWATWCGPCKYEIPYLKKLEEDYHLKNIVFLSYSIDDDRKAWEKFVPENELKGVQIIGEKGWNSKICKDYKIFGVPTFMMFDTDGKIISVNMTRPSDEKTRKTFDMLKGI